MEKSLIKTMEIASKFDITSVSVRENLSLCENKGNIYESPAPAELEGKIYELVGKYAGFNWDDDTMTLDTEEGILEIMPIVDTVYSNSIVGKDGTMPVALNDELYIIAVKEEGCPIYVAVTILRLEERSKFDQIKSLYGRASAIKKLYTQYKDERGKIDYIFDQADNQRYERYEASSDHVFDNRQEQMLKYALTKETYPPETQRTYETLFQTPSSGKYKAERKLQYLSRISPRYKDRTTVDGKKLWKLLNERFYKLDKVKKQIVDVLVSNERAGKRGFNILLVGGPGVGKTSIMNVIAEAVNIPSEIIPLNGLCCPLELEGIDSGYENSDAGRLIRVFWAHGTSEMVIGFDEIDKMGRNYKEGDPMNVLYRMLAGEHEDKFLSCPVSTENTIFIATANSVHNIPEPIMNRFNSVIYIDDYTVEDKMKIATDHIIPKEADKFGIDRKKVKFMRDAIRLIISEYCEDGGVRDLEHNIDMIIRRMISTGMQNSVMRISTDIVREILDELVPETQGILFNKHREEYSDKVAAEIKRCLEGTKVSVNSVDDRFAVDKMRQKLEYLLACKKERGGFSDAFDPAKFSSVLHKNLFGMDKVIKEATVFYHTLSLQGQIINSNLALCGGYGIGKSEIVKNIAAAIGYNFVKISLNGIVDPKELRGFPSTYVGSEPGRVIKGVKEAGSLKTVFQLDEIDKLKPEISIVLLDLLDRSFTDNFLDVPVDFSDSIFIATANDWGNVPPVLRDRFIVVNVDGYTRQEKTQIVSDYVIPKLEKSYAASGVSISIEPDAESYLLETYCPSFGVRDAEKAVQRIVGGKLVAQAGEEDALKIRINRDDVREFMGNEPIPRGNFPASGAVPGVAKALAVCNGNVGNTFAIETVLIDGEESLETTGLPKESTTDSVKIAVACIKRMYPDKLKGKQIHVHFGEGSVPKDGPSAGIAIFMSILSAALNRPIIDKKPNDIAFTGELSLTGGVFAVGGVMEKIQAACDSGCSKVFIPEQNYEMLDKDKLNQFECEVIPVADVRAVVDL